MLKDADLKDVRYGIRKKLDGDSFQPVYYLGENPITLDAKKISYVDKEFPTTPGLLELLTRLQPNLQLCTREDLENYKVLLEMSGLHLNKRGELKNYHGYKTQFIVKPLFEGDMLLGSSSGGASGSYANFSNTNATARVIGEKSKLVDLTDAVQRKHKRLLLNEQDYELAMEKKFKPLLSRITTAAAPTTKPTPIAHPSKNDPPKGAPLSDIDREYFLDSVKHELAENQGKEKWKTARSSIVETGDGNSNDDDDDKGWEDEESAENEEWEKEGEEVGYDDDKDDESNVSEKSSMSASQDRFPNRDRNAPDRYQYTKLGGGFSTDLPPKHPGDSLREQLEKIYYSQAAKSESSHASTDDDDDESNVSDKSSMSAPQTYSEDACSKWSHTSTDYSSDGGSETDYNKLVEKLWLLDWVRKDTRDRVLRIEKKLHRAGIID